MVLLRVWRRHGRSSAAGVRALPRRAAHRRYRDIVTAGDHQAQHDRIKQAGKALDYEQEAIDCVARSWILDDPVCQALALQDAQVWATLHHARVVKETGRPT